MCKKKQKMKIKDESDLFERIALKEYNSISKKKTKDFNSLKLAKLAQDSNGKAIACPDQYVGIINIEKNNCVSSWNVSWVEESISKKTKTDREAKSKEYKNKKVPVLAIVLESPHQDEFGAKNAIGPAIGTSGNNIEKYLPTVIFNYLPVREVENKIYYAPEDQIPNGTYKVLLINAIQYQCSLGEATKKYRDKIFSKMWKEDKVKKDFRDRLESHKPKIVINCCTKGNFEDKEKEEHLRELVQIEINDCCKNIDFLKLRAAHPSSLHFRNGLSKVKEEK